MFSNISWYDLLLGLVIGMLIGWVVEWLWDAAQKKQLMAEHEAKNIALQKAVDGALVAKSTAQHDMDELQAAHTTALSRNDSLDALTQQLQTRQVVLEQEASDSRTHLRQMGSIKQANETLRNKLTSAEGQVRDLGGQNKTLNTTVQGLTTVQAELEQGRLRIEQLEANKQTLRDKLAHTETELATMDAQYATNAEDMGDLQQLQLQYDQSQIALERLRTNQTTSMADSERITLLKNQLDEAEDRLESAEETLLHEQNRIVASDVKLQNMADKLTDERLKVQAYEQELDGLRSGDTTRNITRMRAEMAAQQSEIVELKSKLTTNPIDLTSHITPPVLGQVTNNLDLSDRLQLINGIGNVFAERLQQAGVTTFTALGDLTAERAVEIVQAKSWQAIDATAWIEQAKQLALTRETA